MKYSILMTTLVALALMPAATPPPEATLTVEHIGADSTAFDVIATLVVGPTEVLLWDAQYRLPDAKRVADRIAATGKRLKAIVLSHPDHDHYMGAAAIVERFPGTPVYMTAKALEEYKASAVQQFQAEKGRAGGSLADSLVTPTVLPSMKLTVDGETVEIIPDLVGDVKTGTNSILWIPSISTVLASDLAFNKVHPWLGNSDEASRAEWRKALARIGALKARTVVAGHKKSLDLPDSPDILGHMDRYLADFDSLRKVNSSGPELYQAMIARYPDLAVTMLLRYAAMQAYRKP